MPKGLPSAAELLEQRAVTFFSIDTDVIQALGYKFEDGALRALHLQRPNWIKVCLTEVVQKEVMDHRMDPVMQAAQELQSALTKMQRLSKINIKPASDVVDAMPFESEARNRFELEFNNFVSRLSGEVLPLDGVNLAANLFSRYFSGEAPFEKRKEKKFEFPDAAALLVLESYAKSHKTRGILISKDNGWANFSENSDYLYCVKSLDEFVSLFESEGENADRVKSKIREGLNARENDFFLQIESALERDVENATWHVDDIYSGIGLRVEAYISSVGYANSYLDPDDIKVWFVEHDPSLCTVELQVSVEVNLDVEVEYYQYDTIDHEDMNVASDYLSREATVDLDVFLTCKGNLLRDSVDDWLIDVTVSGGRYRLDVGEVNPDFGREEY